ncbi:MULTISPECIES: hypothetical protein [Bradyrhizobium]|nr:MULTISPECIES: hypothetical protein [Bradyrhizobium]
MWSIVFRALIVVVVVLVAIAAMHGGPFTPLATAEMPAVNVP